MTVPTRLFAPNREELFDLDAWYTHVARTPAATVWMSADGPAFPAELHDALGVEVDEVRARPEHQAQAASIDVFACLRREGKTRFVAGIQSATGDGFGPSVAFTGDPDNFAEILFGRPVDNLLSDQPYRLWAAAVATLQEAEERGVSDCALVVHQLEGDDDISAFAAAVTAPIRILSVRR